jgi:hypothetical protein
MGRYGWPWVSSLSFRHENPLSPFCSNPPPPTRDVISNGNDIETKQNDISIIGVFSVSKRNEPAYSRTLKDRSEANIFMSILCRIEVNTNWVGPNLSRIEQKRAGLVQNFPGSNENELG